MFLFSENVLFQYMVGNDCFKNKANADDNMDDAFYLMNFLCPN